MRSHLDVALRAADPLLNVVLREVLGVGTGLMDDDDAENGPKKVSVRSNYLKEKEAMASTAVDIKESATGYTFYADMPGVSRSDIQVQVESENILSITGKRKRDNADVDESGEGKYVVMERRRRAKFLRKFALPADADVDSISASSADGVLTVKVPKLPPQQPEKPKTIHVPVC